MFQDLTQRLVGAAVITAVAAIFIPMLFDQPVDYNEKRISALKMPDAPADSVNSNAIPDSIDEVISLPKLVTPSAKPAHSKMQRWFIQVGVFSKESNAITLQSTIIKQGFPTTITSVTTDSGLLYKVRVGPELDEKRALAMKQQIDKLNGITGILEARDE